MQVAPFSIRALATRVFVAQLAILVLVLTATTAFAYAQARASARQVVAERTLAIARSISVSPVVREAAGLPDPPARLQPWIEELRTRTQTAFIVVMTPQGTRWTHPDPRKIGEHFSGHYERAALGEEQSEECTGSLGPSLRSVVPVRATDGHVVALVSVGMPMDSVRERLRAQVPQIVAMTALALATAALSSVLVAHAVARRTRGMSSQDLRHLYEYTEAVLHSVNEGLVLIDAQGRLRIVNDEARRLFDLDPEHVGRPVAEVVAEPELAAALTADAERKDELFVTQGRVLVVSQARAHFHGRREGTVVTLRDRTELEAMTGELDSARFLVDALNAQAHEAGNRLHTVVSLVETGHPEQAVAFAAEEIASSQRLTDAYVASVHDPGLVALLLGKTAQASAVGVELNVDPESELPAGVAPTRDLVTVVGNLLDNAIEAVAGQPEALVQFGGYVEQGHAVLEIADNGPGIPAEHRADVLRRGWSTKPGDGRAHGLGLTLVAECVARLGGTLQLDGPPGTVVTVRLPLPHDLQGAS